MRLYHRGVDGCLDCLPPRTHSHLGFSSLSGLFLVFPPPPCSNSPGLSCIWNRAGAAAPFSRKEERLQWETSTAIVSSLSDRSQSEITHFLAPIFCSFVSPLPQPIFFRLCSLDLTMVLSRLELWCISLRHSNKAWLLQGLILWGTLPPWLGRFFSLDRLPRAPVLSHFTSPPGVIDVRRSTAI